jgi:hypothetical protein
MTKPLKIILACVLLIASAVIGWACLYAHRGELHGGIEAYMKDLRKLHKETAAELGKSGDSLPADFTSMERLAQNSQDIYGVFANDPRAKSPAFVESATELMRRATQLEQAWDDARPADAREAMTKLTEACNECHTKVADGGPPKIQFKLPGS